MKKENMKKYSFDDVQLIIDVCEKKFAKTISPSIIENVKSGMTQDDIRDSLLPDRAK